MNWLPFQTIPDTYKDGRRFLTLQAGELFEARYDQSTLPSVLTFRYHRNRVDRRYRYGTVVMNGETFEAQVLPTGEKWPEQFEHVWLVKLRGFEFVPEYWCEFISPGA